MNLSHKPTIAVTGASSFTGSWICRAFALHGWHVHGLYTQAQSSYTDLRKIRLHAVRDLIEVHENVRSDDGTMVQWIEKFKPLMWIHHHHFMESFRSLNYDIEKSALVGVAPLQNIVGALKKNHCAGIIFSGSYFEPGEGKNSISGNETPYAKTKLQVWKNIEKEAAQNEILLSKIVIPDPIGPLENSDRLIPTLIRFLSGQGPFELRAPDAISDHIPVEALATEYVDVASSLLHGRQRIVRPTGWVGSNEKWLQHLNDHFFKPFLKFPSLEIIKLIPDDLSRLSKGQSFENTPGDKVEIDWEDFWKNYANWIKTSQPWR